MYQIGGQNDLIHNKSIEKGSGLENKGRYLSLYYLYLWSVSILMGFLG